MMKGLRLFLPLLLVALAALAVWRILPEPPGSPVAIATVTEAAHQAVTDLPQATATTPPRPTPAGPHYRLRYTIDRSRVPELYYNDISLRIFVGQPRHITVSAGGLPLDFTYDATGGEIVVTSDAAEVEVVISQPSTLDGLGAFVVTPLKYDRRWAWSHSLDDNVGFKPSIELLNERGWRGTLYLIGREISDRRQQDWIVDAPDISRLLAAGWSVGNHTWDHQCVPESLTDESAIETTIIRGQERLEAIVAQSAVPDYHVIAFASPCFRSEYRPALTSLFAANESALLFEESGNDYLLQVDSGATGYTTTEQVALPFSFAAPLGRDSRLAQGPEGVAGVLATFDWMASQSAPDRHFWHNTFDHAGGEQALARVAGYLYRRYGPGGSNEVWVAPADEIYSYLLVRDRGRVSLAGPEPIESAPLFPGQ
jgi:peptidoglycan/xylan/chitin deacetylase (PgdA/CDA1 family)